jgi:hypothetical protein
MSVDVFLYILASFSSLPSSANWLRRRGKELKLAEFLSYHQSDEDSNFIHQAERDIASIGEIQFDIKSKEADFCSVFTLAIKKKGAYRMWS